MPELAYLNGEFCPISQAKVSIEDRGFQFADGVYEVVVFHGERPFMLDEHMERLRASATHIDLPLDLEGLNLPRIMQEGVQQAGFEVTMVYLQVTRGVAPRNHLYPQDCAPTIVMTFKAKPEVDDTVRRRGLKVRTLDDYRWGLCHTKSLVLLPSVIAKNRAVRDGYDDIIWIGPDGSVREAAAANIFVIKDSALTTPPRDNTILHGVTRKWVLSCAREIDLDIREEPLKLPQLMEADEMFLSSTTIDVLPVVSVDDRPIGDGRPGPWSTRLYARMQDHLTELKRQTAV